MHNLVVNIRKQDCQVYIGRKKQGMHFGNPFSHLPLPNAVPVASRDISIMSFVGWLHGCFPEVEPERRKWVLENIPSLKGKTLGCFCAPLACHGEILASAANECIDIIPKTATVSADVIPSSPSPP